MLTHYEGHGEVWHYPLQKPKSCPSSSVPMFCLVALVFVHHLHLEALSGLLAVWKPGALEKMRDAGETQEPSCEAGDFQRSLPWQEL